MLICLLRFDHLVYVFLLSPKILTVVPNAQANVIDIGFWELVYH